MLKLKRFDSTRISKYMLNIRLKYISFLKLNMTVEHTSGNKYMKLHVEAHPSIKCQK